MKKFQSLIVLGRHPLENLYPCLKQLILLQLKMELLMTIKESYILFIKNQLGNAI